jgi:flagellar hook-associated protein 3 FlgL
MTRIATITTQQSALADIMRAQRELSQAQRQMTTGKVADQLKGFGGEAEMLTATRAVLARETSYAEAAKRLEARLDVQGLAIGEVSQAAADLRQALTESLGLDDGRTLMARLEDLTGRVSIALNTKFAGTYLFGGGRDDARPFLASSIEDLAGVAPVSSLFQNGNIRAVARLDDGGGTETGVLADELGAGLIGSLNRIKDFADANGGDFSDPLTAAERAFLTAEITNVTAAFDQISLLEARNGIARQHLEASAERAGGRKAALEMMLSDVEDADMASVVSRIQQTQLALQASAQAFSMLSQSTLLEYLK